VATGSTLLGAEMASFVRGPVSVFLGSVDAMGTPDATRVVGIAVVDRSRLRILVSERAATARRNAQVGASVTVLVTDITNYRSVQWKGRVETAGESRSPGDIALMDHHLTAFKEASNVVGLDPSDAWKLFPTDGVPLVIVVDECFDQTPGPHAGRRVGAPT
jgi:hypothetical protein